MIQKTTNTHNKRQGQRQRTGEAGPPHDITREIRCNLVVHTGGGADGQGAGGARGQTGIGGVRPLRDLQQQQQQRRQGWTGCKRQRANRNGRGHDGVVAPRLVSPEGRTSTRGAAQRRGGGRTTTDTHTHTRARAMSSVGWLGRYLGLASPPGRETRRRQAIDEHETESTATTEDGRAGGHAPPTAPVGRGERALGLVKR